MDYKKFISFIKNDFEKSNDKYQSIKFFRSNIILIFIWFWTLEKMYNKKDLNIEKLIDDIQEALVQDLLFLNSLILLLIKNIY